jgi:hypothetical protein
VLPWLNAADNSHATVARFMPSISQFVLIAEVPDDEHHFSQSASPVATTNQQSRSMTTMPAVQATQPAQAAERNDVVTTAPASTATRPVRPYTSPSASVRIASLRQRISGRFRHKGLTTGGSEQAEASIQNLVGSSRTGTAGVRASQPTTAGVVNSIPGLQRGFATGLGLAREQNLFTFQRNPSRRACQELIRAGFFADQSACDIAFNR